MSYTGPKDPKRYVPGLPKDGFDTQYELSGSITLTTASATTTTVPVMLASRNLLIKKITAVYTTASSSGTVPNIEVGMDTSLTNLVSPVAAKTSQAVWTQQALTVNPVNNILPAGHTLLFSIVSSGATTNTGQVAIAVEFEQIF